MAILKYPLRPPVPDSNDDADGPTKAIDYLAIRRSRIKYGDNKKWYGENIPNNEVTREYNDNACYLAMPAQIGTQYSPSYQRTDIGVGGVMAASLMAGNTSESSLNDIAQSVQSAAQGGLPEFAASTIATAANGLNNILGLAGNVSANSLTALAKGKVFNPFTEQIFNSMAFRTHTFAFKFLSRDENEAQMVKQIIDYIKIGSGPIIMAGEIPKLNANEHINEAGKKAREEYQKTVGGVTDKLSEVNAELAGAASKYRFMEVPDKFHLKFMRMSPDGTMSTGQSEHALHFRMHTSVCTGVNVNYTPDGQYTSFKRIRGDMVQVPAIQMTVSFTETRMVTQRDMLQGY